MTLLATTCRKAAVSRARRLDRLLNVYAQRVIAVTISSCRGLFWFAITRLAVGPEGSRGGILNLVFLLSIIILCRYERPLRQLWLDSVVRRIYGIHRYDRHAECAVVILALRGHSDATLLATALFPILVFVIGTTVAHSLRGGAVPVVPAFFGAVRRLARDGAEYSSRLAQNLQAYCLRWAVSIVPCSLIFWA